MIHQRAHEGVVQVRHYFGVDGHGKLVAGLCSSGEEGNY